MRSEYPPIREDPSNINGGSFTNRYSINESQYHFTINSALLIGENFSPYINGVSVSPKTKNSIIRLWTTKIINNEEILKSNINLNEYKFDDKNWKYFSNRSE